MAIKIPQATPNTFYVADFYCHAVKLVIELDGSIHNNEFVKANDNSREIELKSLGLTILRFTNKQVFSDIKHVLYEIKLNIEKIKAKKN